MFSREKIVTHRERVICTLNHEEPDRVPIDYGSMLSTGIHVFAQRKLKCYLGLKDTPDEVVDIHQQLAAPDPSIRKVFDADIYPVFALPSTKWSSKIVEEDDYAYWTDEWGTVYRKPKEGWWYDLYQFPLQNIDTISGLKRYKWPDPEDSGRIEGLADTKKLKKEFGRYLTFWGGGCDTQRVLPFGNPEDVKKEVKRRINDLAPEGGFVFCQVHNIQPEVPPENIVTMFQSTKKYGRYPINI